MQELANRVTSKEQWQLHPSMFVRSSNPDCYMYVEHGSKNHSGGLKQLSLENKQIDLLLSLKTSRSVWSSFWTSIL